MKTGKKKQIAYCLLAVFLSGGGACGCVSREQKVFLEEAKALSAEDSASEKSKEEAIPEEAEEKKQEEEPQMVEPTAVPQKIFVDVCGAVVQPGVYTFPAESRVFEAVKAAGGYLPEAAGYCINQAQPLQDGQQIYVPTVDEAQQAGPAASEGVVQSREIQNASEQDGTKVNLNTADETELIGLNGIGEAKAKAILTYREENGAFSSTDEIMNVPGIKEGTYEKIKDEIAVE